MSKETAQREPMIIDVEDKDAKSAQEAMKRELQAYAEASSSGVDRVFERGLIAAHADAHRRNYLTFAGKAGSRSPKVSLAVFLANVTGMKSAQTSLLDLKAYRAAVFHKVIDPPKDNSDREIRYTGNPVVMKVFQPDGKRDDVPCEPRQLTVSEVYDWARQVYRDEGWVSNRGRRETSVAQQYQNALIKACGTAQKAVNDALTLFDATKFEDSKGVRRKVNDSWRTVVDPAFVEALRKASETLSDVSVEATADESVESAEDKRERLNAEAEAIADKRRKSKASKAKRTKKASKAA